ncbi:MAG TPA: efflux RND transporter periplasmic adaptor subunit [Fimbriimonas sp.]
MKVERRDIVGYVTFPGQLDVPPGSVATVHPPYNAPVEKVMAAVGQRVRKGEALIDLAMGDAESAFEANRDALKEAETALANAKVQYGATVKEIERQLAEARSRERTLRDYARTSGDATQLQAATDARVALEQQLTQAKLEMNENVRPYQEQLDQVRSTFRQAQSGVKQGQITAPISGTVLEMNATAGKVVGEDRNEVLAKIVKLGAIRVKATPDADAAAHVKDRADVVVRFAELPDEVFDGRVTSIRKVPGNGPGNTETLVTIDFKNDMGQIKPEMKVASVGVAVGKVERALSVPAEAIGTDASGKPFVHRLQNGAWVPVVVEPGLSDGDYTEVKSGLMEGDTVQSPIRVSEEAND